MNAIRRLLITVCFATAFVAAAWYAWRSWDMRGAYQSTEDAYVRGEITILSPRVAGYAVSVLKDENEPVAAKEVLIKIDPRDYRAAATRAQATVDQAQAALGQASAQLELQSSQIEVGEAALKAAQAQAENAELTYQRAKELLEKGSGTQAAYDQANATVLVARASVEQAKAQLDFQRKQVVVLQANVRAAEAKVNDGKAAFTAALQALEDTEVWSPIAGTIANRRTRVGEYVTIGTNMLSIVPNDGLWIAANFRETQLARMWPDQPVAIMIDLYGGRRVCGYVEAIGPAAASEFALLPPDNATGNFTKIVRRFPVRIRANRSDPNRDALKPGMSTKVTVSIDSPEVLGCRFDPDKDRQTTSMAKLPEIPVLNEPLWPAPSDGKH